MNIGRPKGKFGEEQFSTIIHWTATLFATPGASGKWFVECVSVGVYWCSNAPSQRNIRFNNFHQLQNTLRAVCLFTFSFFFSCSTLRIFHIKTVANYLPVSGAFETWEITIAIIFQHRQLPLLPKQETAGIVKVRDFLPFGFTSIDFGLEHCC